MWSLREERKLVVFEELGKCRGKSKQTIHQKRRQLSNEVKWNSNEKIHKRQFREGAVPEGWGSEGGREVSDYGRKKPPTLDELRRCNCGKINCPADVGKCTAIFWIARNRRRHKSLWLTAADHDSGCGFVWWTGGVGTTTTNTTPAAARN